MTTCACGNCQFFDNQTSAGKTGAATQMGADEGICRFNPPLPQPGAHSHGVWPVVGKQDWCGHFHATVERFMTAA